MKDYVTKVGIKGALDLQSYKNIKLNQAVNGRGLLQNKAFIQMLITVCPYASYKTQDLKFSFVQMSNEFDGLTGVLARSTDRWASELSERTMVMLNHVRRLRSSELRLRQAIGKLDDAGVKALKNLVNQVIPSDALVSMESQPSKLMLCDQKCIAQGSGKAVDDCLSDSMSVGLKELFGNEPVAPSKHPKKTVKSKRKRFSTRSEA